VAGRPYLEDSKILHSGKPGAAFCMRHVLRNTSSEQATPQQLVLIFAVREGSHRDHGRIPERGA